MEWIDDLDHIWGLEEHETPGVTQKQNKWSKGKSAVKDENLFRRHFLRDRGLRIRANARSAIEGTSTTVGMMPS